MATTTQRIDALQGTLRKSLVLAMRQVGISPRGTIKKLPYIFIIGYNKCGTTALQRFFYLNGYPAIPWDQNRLGLRIIHNLVKRRRILSGYDRRYRVFSDFNISNEYLAIELNHLVAKFMLDYPDSYFILNTRPVEHWIRSRASQVSRENGTKYIEIRAEQLSCRTEEIADRWRKDWELHHQFVRRFFSGAKANKLLEVDIEDNSTPDRIGEFLGFEPVRGSWRRVRTN